MGKSKGLSPTYTGAAMAGEQLKNNLSIPTQEDANAKLYKELSGSFGSKAGGRPRGGWRNFASGLFQGLEHVETSKAIAKKTAKAEKYDKVMDYFQQVNDSAIERNEWYEKRESARQEFLPQVVAYADNIDKLDPQSQRIMAQSILEGYGRAIGEDFKLMAIDGSNPFVMTVESSKGAQVFDVRSMFAGDKVMEQQLAMKMPEYQMKLQNERQDKEREFALKEKEHALKMYEKGVPGGQYGTSGGANGEGKTLEIADHSYKVGNLSGVEKTARAEYQKKVYKDVDSIPKNNQALEAIETMREVFERNPNIGSSFINMLDNPDGTESWFNLIGRKLSGQDLSDMEILKKATNDLNLDTILGITGKAATDLLKRAVQAASPSGKLTKKGFDVNAAKWEKKARQNNELAMAKYEAMQKGLSLVPNPYGSSQNMTSQKMPTENNEIGGDEKNNRWNSIWMSSQ